MKQKLFEQARKRIYSHHWKGQALVQHLAGGTPSDPKVIRNWLRSKFEDKEEQITRMVQETMEERGLDANAALENLAETTNVNGFKRGENGLYVEGRQLKACLKEAANIRWAKERWGPTKKGTMSYFAEHVFVLENQIPLGLENPDFVNQTFVHTWRGSSIKYEEVVKEAKIEWTIVSDVAIPETKWEDLWVTAERQGLGASRSQGNGQFTMVGWEKLTIPT